MPSLRALILGLAFALLALIQLSAATPVPTVAAPAPPAPPAAPAGPAADCLPTPPTKPSPALPLSGDATELPAAPPAGQTLQYVALGRGVQNYTCLNTTMAPVALGAVATLFDGTALATANEATFNALPPLAVYLPLTALPPPIATAATLGHHFFGADGTPTFDLSAKGKILFCRKTADIKAPAGANVGPAKTGAVDWLQLVAKDGVESVGLQTVYRVVTAGGNPPAVCPSVGVISVQYAAEYWFYD